MPIAKFPARQKHGWCSCLWRLSTVLALAVVLCLIHLPPASAQDLNPKDYFQLSYDPVTLDKNEIQGSEVFHVNIAGRATCTQDLPMPASEASVTSKIIARHTASNTMVTLNPGYTITVKPFPSKKDETAEIKQSVPLQFPSQAEPGEYSIIGKIIEAKIKILVWVPVTSYLPQEQPMGKVKYTASGSTGAPAIPENPPSPGPEPAPPPLKATPSGSNAPSPQPPISPEPELIIPWWVWLIVVAAIVTTVMNVISLLRRRAR